MPARWQLRQLFMRQGSHLPKREKALLYQPSNFKRTWGMHHFMSNDEPAPGNLPKDQYRYFQGCKAMHATYTKCRTCENAFTSHEQRLAHIKNSGCNRIFNDALKVWLGNARRISTVMTPCAVCNAMTLHRKWGIPLCMDVVCYEKWMFDILVPVELKVVLKGILGA